LTAVWLSFTPRHVNLNELLRNGALLFFATTVASRAMGDFQQARKRTRRTFSPLSQSVLGVVSTIILLFWIGIALTSIFICGAILATPQAWTEAIASFSVKISFSA